VVSRSRRTTADRKSCVRPQNAHYPLVRDFCIGTCGCAACAQANIVRMSRRRVWQSHRSAIHVREKDYLACCGYGARQEGENSASHMRPQAKRGRMCIKSSPLNMLSRGNVGVGFRCLRIPDGQGEVCLDFGSPSAWTGARTEFPSSSLNSRFWPRLSISSGAAQIEFQAWVSESSVHRSAHCLARR